jgi:hypothetical protein
MTVDEYEEMLEYCRDIALDYSHMSEQERELYWRMRELEARLKDR